MTDYRATAATDAVYRLGEGILWDDREGLARWVDISTGRVLAAELRDGRLHTVQDIAIGQTAGAVGLTEDGGLVVAAARGIATISVSGEISIGPDILDAHPGSMCNDAAVDPQGRFVVGTLTSDQDTGTEVLLRVSPDGRVEVIRDGIRLSNGIAFSPDGTTIYHVDTFASTISSHSYGPGEFDADEPWATVLDNLAPLPDGLTVDSGGALWLAYWGGSNASRYAPTGELLDVVTVDATQASCPGLIGPALTTLAITSAQDGLAQFSDQSGAIFLTEVPVPGVPEHRWAGSTSQPYWLPKPIGD